MPAEHARPVTRRRDGCTRSRSVLRPLAAGVALAFASMLAQAQNLQELYDAARGYDATYLAARSAADAAQSRLAQSDALRLPSANLAASSTRSYSDVPQLTDNYLATVNQVALTARQPLYNRANGETISQAEKSYEIATADLETAEQDLIVRIAQAYFDVLAAQDTLNTTQANKVAITEQLASAKRNFEVGTATITDTRDAQARFDLVRAQEIAAQNDLRSKRAALDTLVGRSGIAPKPLAVPVAIPPLSRGNVDDWLNGADADNPNVRKARLAFDIAQIETEKARSGHLPTLDLVGTVSSNHNDGVSNVGTGTGTLPGLYRNASIGLQFNLPVFSGFAVQNRVKETLALAEKARNDLDSARRSVALGTRQAFLGVESGQALVKALEAAESSSQLALEATQLGYKVGVRVTLDVLNAQTQLYTTQRDLDKSRYDLVMGGLRLRQAAGQLKSTDVSAVNQLLSR
jgi:outer membrane protein